METEYIVLGDVKEDREKIKKAATVIKNGGLVAFPTETVYGLGGDGLNQDSSKKIYRAKGRPSDNPLILHVVEFEDIVPLVREIPNSAKILAEKFWPGPMTLVMKKSDLVPLETTGGLDTVAIRIPSHEVARALILEAGLPIAAPSANRSGRPSPTKANHVKEDLFGEVDMILDGGEVGIGIESTIIDVTEEKPMILRPGFITKKMLSELFLEVEEDMAVKDPFHNKEQKPKAPGMKYRHYAPKGRMIIFEGNRERVIKEINEQLREIKEKGQRTGVLATNETKQFYEADVVLTVGSYCEAEEIAHNLFSVLREFDRLNVEVIFSESFADGELGESIMNRLKKAAGYQIRKLD